MSKFKDRFFAEFTALLSQRTGIDLGTLNGVNIENIIAKKIHSSETKKLEEYYLKITQETQVFNELIEDIVIPETSFFRHTASFAFLRQYCLEKNTQKSTFRILSVPCSTGEEPYSIAITLLEAGIDPGKIAIDAFDISDEAIAKAITGEYKKYAFRSNNELLEQYHLKKYFDQKDQLYHIKPEVKSLVNFRQGNLVNNDFLNHFFDYDIIFCRNVLIYFSDFARRQVLHKLYQSLSEQGLLFIGYAETNFINPEHFHPLGVPHAFVYEKRTKQMILQPSFADKQKVTFSQKTQQPLNKLINNDLHYKKLTDSMQILTNNIPSPSKKLTNSGSRSINQPNNRTNKTTNQTTQQSTFAKSNQKTPPTKTQIVGQELEQEKSEQLLGIRQLANQGQLDSALTACQQYVKNYPTNAGGYLLLGEIYQAQNLDLEAYTAFKKALYLDPECTDSLTHLIFLSEQQRNYEQAERYRQRLQSKTTDSA